MDVDAVGGVVVVGEQEAVAGYLGADEHVFAFGHYDAPCLAVGGGFEGYGHDAVEGRVDGGAHVDGAVDHVDYGEFVVHRRLDYLPVGAGRAQVFYHDGVAEALSGCLDKEGCAVV